MCNRASEYKSRPKPQKKLGVPNIKIFHKNERFLNVEKTESLFGSMRGLMFKKLREGHGLLMDFPYVARWSIWMPFVPQDIAVFFIDKNNTVVDKKLAKRLTMDPRTWKVYKPQEGCKYVLECRSERFDDIEIDEKIVW